MYDLTVMARAGRWLLLDDEDCELGAFTSRAEALKAAGDYGCNVDPEPRHVLIQESSGVWTEAVVEPPAYH